MTQPSPPSPEPPRIIGVIDILGGVAVHARAGARSEYAPVAEAAGVSIQGDATALASTYVDVIGVRELYVADLDAIQRGFGAMQASLIGRIAAAGVPVWVDAGVSTAGDAHAVLAAGASMVVVGLETLPSFDALAAICAAVGGSRVAFSLDLRGGAPVVAPNAPHEGDSPVEIVRAAAGAGVTHVIVIDLARVGVGARIDADLVAAIRDAVPRVALFPGGGVRDASDIAELARLGCRGVLVATALLEGSVKCDGGRGTGDGRGGRATGDG